MHNISVCSSIKNRCIVPTDYGTRYLFQNFLLSLKNVSNNREVQFELVICDFGSTDVDDLESYVTQILENTDIKIKIILLDKKFNRGFGCNTAIESSSYDNILLLDVDMKFGMNLIDNVVKYTCVNKYAYFPICYTFENDPYEQNGSWLDVGYGNFSINKSYWQETGKIPEYDSWGKEDLDFYKRLSCLKIREKCENLIHQWHPSDITWKNRYYQ